MDMQLGSTRSHIPSPIRHNQSVKIYLILLKITLKFLVGSRFY